MAPSTLPVSVLIVALADELAELARARLRRVPGDLAELAGSLHGLLLVRLSREQLQRLERIGWPCADWALTWRAIGDGLAARELARALELDEAAWHAADRARR